MTTLTDLDALVARLNDAAYRFGDSYPVDAARQREAAAALVQLREENARLAADYNVARDAHDRVVTELAVAHKWQDESRIYDALREPTETMIVAGVKTLLTGHDSQRHYVAALWRRMFDAAKEKP